MKLFIRTFSLGLLTATIILSIAYWTDDRTPQSQNTLQSEDEMITILEEKGYSVLTNQELKDIKKRNQPPKIQEDLDEQPIQPTSFIIDITQGTTSKEISIKLKNAQIIEDAEAFDQFMKKKDYSRYIQIGQVTLSEDMTHQEIAEAITSK